MPTNTDPAKDLASVCKKLATSNVKRGDEHLAGIFGVPLWSKDFYQIIFCIIERADLLIEIVQSLDDMDDEIKADAIQHIEKIKKAFTRSSFSNAWNQHGLQNLNAENIQAIRMLSSAVRKKACYPEFSADEINELIIQVDQLEKWLIEHQLSEKDFIRQAIIDGLKQFRFRLLHVGWLGWGYATESLREVISAYLILEGIKPDPAQSPDSVAILKKVSSFIGFVWEKANDVKGATETADFILKAYGSITLASQGFQGIAALITHVK